LALGGNAYQKGVIPPDDLMFQVYANTPPAFQQGHHSDQLVTIQDAWAPSPAHVLQLQWLLPFPHIIPVGVTPKSKAFHSILTVASLQLQTTHCRAMQGSVL